MPRISQATGTRSQLENTAQRTPTNEPTLVGIQTCLEQVFPDSSTRPGLRTFHKWKAQGFIPFLKIGKRIFFDPEKVRKALDKQFEIQVRGEAL